MLFSVSASAAPNENKYHSQKEVKHSILERLYERSKYFPFPFTIDFSFVPTTVAERSLALPLYVHRVNHGEYLVNRRMSSW